MQRLLALVVVSNFLAGSLSATEIEDASARLDISYGHSPADGKTVQTVVELEPTLDLDWSRSTSLRTSARIRVDVEDQLEPGRANTDTYASASRPLQLGNTGTAELRQFYIENRFGKGLLRLGKQPIVWGRLDGIKVLDVVNPQDFREFILDDFADSRIELWSAYLDYTFGDWRAELALLADGTGHAIPNSGAWFELTAPRFRYGAQPGQASPPVVTVTPGHGDSEGGYGARLSRQLGNLELAFVAYSGTDPEPLGRLAVRDGIPVVERFFERRETLGASVDKGLGPAVLRAEYAYQPDRTFNTRSPLALDTVDLDQHRGAIGLDLDGPLGVFINAQYLVDTIDNAPRDLVRPAVDRIGTLYLRRSFSYDALAVAARWYHSFTDGDDLATLSLDYALGDASTLRLAAEWFSGGRAGLFGQFSGRDRIVLSFQHTF